MYGVMTEEEQYAELLLKNTANYGPYKDLVTGDGTMCINCRNINDINIDDHLNWIYNILLDGINLEKVQGYMLYVSFLDMAVTVIRSAVSSAPITRSPPATLVFTLELPEMVQITSLSKTFP